MTRLNVFEPDKKHICAPNVVILIPSNKECIWQYCKSRKPYSIQSGALLKQAGRNKVTEE